MEPPREYVELGSRVGTSLLLQGAEAGVKEVDDPRSQSACRAPCDKIRPLSRRRRSHPRLISCHSVPDHS